MKTYYSTTAENAARILQHGFTDGVVRVGAHGMLGVALFGRITDPTETWLEVELDEDLLAPYSVPGVPGEMTLWVVPARLLADRGSRRLVSRA
jgi:hypothetical protein